MREPRLPKSFRPRLSWPTMFPYDPVLLAAVQSTPQAVTDVVQILETIEATCADGDGLKWFNWLYLRVTQAAQARVNSGGFADSGWIAALDVRFARFYFAAVQSSLSGQSAPGCWQALFDQRSQPMTARIQFAMSGINAHINHDLPLAIMATCQDSNVVPCHDTAHYSDYTALNSTLDDQIDAAKQTLRVRLLGDALPPVSALEDTVGAWSVSAAREAAWNNAELLWHLSGTPTLSANFLDTLDGLTTVAGKTLLVPIA